ncbi:sugar ABC transporter ATP-binding protein [Trueperella sp. LYQ141]|uniref:sugar ABC transporter ATP-binding protein n=1 Tax=Trueperella sp. LYQ141 TaxID=3391058 RepID=UPI003983291A
MEYLLETEDLVQEYPGVKALKGVSLAIRPGEIRALVGENGAGKSTLIRIIAGIERPVSGRVRIRGVEKRFRNSLESQNAGVAVVSQEFRLVPELTVADNILLGHELSRCGFVSKTRTKAVVERVLAELGVDISPYASVSSLTMADRQLVEIARALSMDFDVLIMDEPTAALHDAEVERLHAMVRKLRDSGKAIVYVSHRLDEIFSLCDNVTVLRDGRHIVTQEIAQITEEKLVEHMLGKKPMHYVRSTDKTGDDPVLLQLDQVKVPGLYEALNMQVRRGEVLGIAGLVGSGRGELVRALFGERPILSGKLSIDGQTQNISSNYDALASGIFMLPEERKTQGIITHLDVRENMMLSRKRRNLPRGSRILPSKTEENTRFNELRERMNIRVSSGKQLIGQLSGGNQQKVLLGRAMLSGCQILILNEPTRGVDVGAKAEIYELIWALARSGVCVLISSSDASELAAVAQRCLVFFAGRCVAELSGTSVNEEAIIAACVGQSLESSTDDE